MAFSVTAKILVGVLLGVGLLMVIIGSVILATVFPNTLEKKIAESLELREGNEAAERFADSPVPAYMSFYFFNVTNKDAVNENGTKPVLQEVGPYVFRQKKIKNIIKWNVENGTVLYQENTSYIFEKDMSKGDLSDEVNLVNAISIGIATSKIVMGFNGYEQFISEAPKQYIDNNTVDAFLFAGIDMKPYFPPNMPIPVDIICMPGFLAPCMSGFYFGKNNTLSKTYEVFTGVKGMENYGEIRRYDKKDDLSPLWRDHCNAINGTDGKQFPPDVDKEKGLYVFSSDVCRSFALKFKEQVIVEDIDALRYTIPERVFENPNCNKDNMCFCTVVQPYQPCPSKSGVFSVADCQEGKPVAMSAPHFYMGETDYVDNFEGLKPDMNKHQTFIDIEPLTGTAIQAAKRLQVNIIVIPSDEINPPLKPKIPFLKHVKRPVYFPVMWVEEGGRIDKKNAQDFREKVTNPYKSTKWGLVACIAIGGVLLLLVPVVAFFMAKR